MVSYSLMQQRSGNRLILRQNFSQSRLRASVVPVAYSRTLSEYQPQKAVDEYRRPPPTRQLSTIFVLSLTSDCIRAIIATYGREHPKPTPRHREKHRVRQSPQ